MFINWVASAVGFRFIGEEGEDEEIIVIFLCMGVESPCEPWLNK